MQYITKKIQILKRDEQKKTVSTEQQTNDYDIENLKANRTKSTTKHHEKETTDRLTQDAIYYIFYFNE